MIFPSLLLAIVHFSSSTLAFNLHNPTTSIIIRNSNSKNVRVASSSSPSSPSSSPTKLYISNLFKGETDRTPQLPKDVKEAVSKCRQAVQKGLENKMSRMDIEFPVGTKFGVENNKNSNKRKGGKLASALAADNESSSSSSSSSSSGITRDMLDTSDRELARLFVEMFQPLGGDHISVVFHDSNLADAARQSWKNDVSAECKVLSLNKGKKMKSTLKIKNTKGMGIGGGSSGGGMGMGKKGSGRKSKKVAFATKMNEELNAENSGPFKLPDSCELAIFIAPTVKDLNTVKTICDDVGMGTLVILLNARLGLVDNFGSEDNQQFFENEFEKVFYLSIASQEAAPGCLMHRAYPNDWIVARKPKVGSPKTIATFAEKPNDDECREAYESIEVGDVERVTENVLDNVASWLN